MKNGMSLTDGFENLIKERENEQKNSTVVVYDTGGNLLKPCTNKRARILLERGHAVIVSYVPFSIRLEKEMGEQPEKEYGLHKGAVQACVSSIGQNRTDFMLDQALQLSKKHQKVLFVSTIVNESILNEMIAQEVKKEETAFVEYFHAFSVLHAGDKNLSEWMETFEPDVVIIDHWKNQRLPLRLAKKENVAIWCGISPSRKIERMPVNADIFYFDYEQDTSLIMGLYGNQVSILKNRFGPNGGSAMHRNNIILTVE